jgi:hypothetical protein
MDTKELKTQKEWMQILNRSGKDRSFSISDYQLRDDWIKDACFPILTKETIDVLAKLLKGRRVVDAGCGRAYLAYQLHKRDIDIIAVDNYSTKYNTGFLNASFPYMRVIEEPAIGWIRPEFGAIIMSWPDMKSNFAEVIVEKMISGQLLVYQGESESGCTATEEFFNLVNSEKFKYMKDFSKRLNKWHLQFSGIHDYWSVYLKNAL